MVSRLAIVLRDSCKSKDCGLACIKYCPVNRMGQDCIILDDKKKAVISELLCTGCGICVKKCPFKAIKIINLPSELDKDLVHRYGENQFALYRLPVPRQGKVTGLVGQNGAGKSTSLKLLSGELPPNLGRWDNPPDWNEIIHYFRGSELQNYFESIKNNQLKVVYKPQAVSRLSQVVKGKVGELLKKADERGIIEEIKTFFNLEHLWDRELKVLSGGELQRVAIAAAISRDADVYLFDEPTSYLDVSERVRMAKGIRKLAEEANKTIVVVEHDLAILDYLSDYVSIYYGEAGAYGVVTHPMSVREGINVFLEGYIPSENVRFRSEPLKFQKAMGHTEMSTTGKLSIEYGAMTKKYETFELKVDEGKIYSGEIVGILGPNGIGKTTFVKILAGVEEPTEIDFPIRRISKKKQEENEQIEEEKLKVSYKPQYISTESTQTVEIALRKVNPKIFSDSFLKTELVSPLGLDKLKDKELNSLSGGELQKVAIALCISRDADIYLLDEPSAFISSEDRVTIGKAIRRLVAHKNAVAFIVEHDLMLQSYLSDRIIVFEGVPGIRGQATRPLPLKDGMNRFLKTMGITFRKDPQTGRPRVNKENSRLDKEQKASGQYFYI